MAEYSVGRNAAAIPFMVCLILSGITDGVFSYAGPGQGGAPLLNRLAIWLTAAYWLSKNRNQRGVPRVWDLGFFLYSAWYFILPYHLVKSRGWGKSFLIVLLILGTYVTSYFFGHQLRSLWAVPR